MAMDPLYDAAVALVRLFDKASTSFLQRKFGIPYDRAADLMLAMQNGGFVSAPDHDGARRVIDPFVQGGITPEPPPFPGHHPGFVHRAEHERLVGDLMGRLSALEGQINSPIIADWFDGVRNEAVHQRERWGAEHDAGKSPLDWFWLLGFLAQKAAASAMAGDADKAKHHTISTAAALFNWFRQIDGDAGGMRPGIETPHGEVR